MSTLKKEKNLIAQLKGLFQKSIISDRQPILRKSPSLENLESRLVPTFNYVVTNITDVPGEAGGPLEGSLRRGLQLASLSNEDAVITFDPTLFNSTTPQTIKLNGVDGALLISNPSIEIKGPGTSSDFTPLTIQAADGIAKVGVIASGAGYKPGDILYQPVGAGPGYVGGAQFTVTSVGANGAITGIYVQKPGSGQQIGDILDSTLFPATLINISGTGSGAKLQVETLRAASGIFVTQGQVGTASVTSLSGMTLGNSYSLVSGSSVGAIYHIGGSLNLSSVFLNGDLGRGIQGAGIYTQSGSGPVSIKDSKVINVSEYGIYNDNYGSITVDNSLFQGNDLGGIYSATAQTGSNPSIVSVSNSEFNANGDSLTASYGSLAGGIYTNSQLKVSNSYFTQNISGYFGGAIEVHGTNTVITSSFFNSNSVVSDYSYLDANSQPMGGGAIWNGSGSLTISDTGFTKNQANFFGRDSGGGAVYNQSGSLTLSQSTFYDNVANIFTNPRQVSVPPDATIADPSQYPTSRYSGGGALYSGGATSIKQVTFGNNRVDAGVNIYRMPGAANWGVTIPIQPMYSGGGAVYLTNYPTNGSSIQSLLTEVTFADNSVNATSAPGTADTVDFVVPLTQAGSPGTIDTDVYGRGLTGGALIIADGHNRANLNTNHDDYIASTNSVQLINLTVTNNKVNNQLLPITSANGSGPVNSIDAGAMVRGISGGIFMDTAPGNTTGATSTNSLLVSNYGANNINGKYINNVETDIGTQSGNFNINLILNESSSYFNSAGHNYYSGVGIQLSNVTNPSAPYAGQVIGPGPGDIRDIPQNLLDPNGLAYNPGPNTTVGMSSPNIFTQSFKTDVIKTVGLTRNSPARDTGDMSVFPTLSTPFDNRFINRAVNLAIDIGAYEAQLPSLAVITAPTPNPAEYGQPVTIGVTINSDGVNSKVGIVGTVYLENSKTGQIIASNAVKGLPPAPGQQATVSTSFLINNLAGTYFAASNTYDLRAFFDNSTDFAPSKTDIVQLTVNPAVTTTTLNSGSPNPSAVNTPVLFTGTVVAQNSTASPDGSVTLYDVTDPQNPLPLISSSVNAGAYSLSYIFPLSQVYNVQAKYSSSSGSFAQSSSSVQVQDVGQLLSVALGISPSTINKGQSTDLIADVLTSSLTPISGPVEFSYTNSQGTKVVLGSVLSSSAVPITGGLRYTLNVNSVTANLPLGTLPVVASYIRQSGDPYVGASSAPVNLVVNGQLTTTSLSIIPSGSTTFGTLVQLTATVNPTGTPLPFGASTVSFYDGSTLLGTQPINTTTRQAIFTTVSLSGGIHNNITAVYSGDGSNYVGSTSSPQSITINPRGTTTTLTAAPATGVVGAPVTLTANIIGVGSTAQMASPAGAVTFTDGSTVLGTATLNSNGQGILTVPSLSNGPHSLSAVFTPSNGNYSSSQGALNYVVKKVINQPYYAIAPGQGSTLVGFSTTTNKQAFAVMPFGPTFKGGMMTATGDTNGDGTADIIVAAGVGGNSTIKIYDGLTLGVIATFQAYGGYNGAVNVAAGDLNNDGYADIITAPGSKGPTSNVKAFSGKNGQLMRSFIAYAGYTGGVTVAAGDVNGDGYSDIITGPQIANPPHVKVFSGQNGATLQSFYAYSAAFNGGIYVASGDFNGDGYADIATGANAGGGPHVVVVSGANPKVKLGSFFAYSPSFSGGVRVGAADINGDGLPELITGAGAGIGPLVTRWALPTGASNFKQIDQFFAYGPGSPNNYLAGTFPSV